MHPGRTRSKHYRVQLMPVAGPENHVEFERVKVLTPAGRRRRRRRVRLLEAVEAGLTAGDTLREAFRAAVEVLGPRTSDRRWAWAWLNRNTNPQEAA